MPNSGIAGSYGKCTFSFKRNNQIIFQCLFHFIFLPAIYERSSFFVFSSVLSIVINFYFGYSNKYTVITHHGINFNSPNNKWYRISFQKCTSLSMLLRVYPLWWSSSSCLLPIFELIVLTVEFWGSLSILHMTRLSSHPFNEVFYRVRVFKFWSSLTYPFFFLLWLCFAVLIIFHWPPDPEGFLTGSPSGCSVMT